MAIICITYILLISPALFIDIIFIDIEGFGLLIFALCIFQYSSNIFVYLVTKKDYRVAYFDTLNRIFCNRIIDDQGKLDNNMTVQYKATSSSKITQSND